MLLLLILLYIYIYNTCQLKIRGLLNPRLARAGRGSYPKNWLRLRGSKAHMYTYIHLSIYISLSLSIYIYIYIHLSIYLPPGRFDRVRAKPILPATGASWAGDGVRVLDAGSTCLICMYVYVYIHIYIYVCRESMNIYI